MQQCKHGRGAGPVHALPLVAGAPLPWLLLQRMLLLPGFFAGC